MPQYVHGYSQTETCRLSDQANTLAELLHHDTHYPSANRVLEAGCGIGAQTVILADNSREAQFISIDISQESIDTARKTAQQHQINNVHFQRANIFDLPFADASFDHVFVCFVLEHLSIPDDALMHLSRVLKPGGSITVIEGDHGSFYCYPESREAQKAVQCLIDLQAQAKGNSLIGRQLYPLLCGTQFRDVRVSPRMVYVDSSKPEWVEGFSIKTFTAMVEGVKDQAIAAGMIDETTWIKGINDLYRATEHDGTFCYTFFKAVAVK